MTKIGNLLVFNCIRPSKSLYGAPILFAKKKDGSLRISIDYHALNKSTATDSYPLLCINEMLNCLRGSEYISSLYLRDRYH